MGNDDTGSSDVFLASRFERVKPEASTTSAVEELRKQLAEHFVGWDSNFWYLFERSILDLLEKHDSMIRDLASGQAEHEVEHPFLGKHGVERATKEERVKFEAIIPEDIIDEGERNEREREEAVTQARKERDEEWWRRIRRAQDDANTYELNREGEGFHYLFDLLSALCKT